MTTVKGTLYGILVAAGAAFIVISRIAAYIGADVDAVINATSWSVIALAPAYLLFYHTRSLPFSFALFVLIAMPDWLNVVETVISKHADGSGDSSLYGWHMPIWVKACVEALLIGLGFVVL